MLPPNFIREMIGNGKLQEMPRNSFVSEDGARIFNGCANVKILRLRIISGDEIETGWILVINPRRIHKTSRAGRLERLRQLADLESSEVIGNADEMMFL